jgi:cytochrome c-type biogenesis protein
VGPEEDPQRLRSFFHALAFVAGFTVFFVALGTAVGLMGYYVSGVIPLLRQIAGVMLIVLGLHVAGILRISFLYQERRLNINADGKISKFGYLRSFAIGSAFSIGWTPCVGPILGGILTLAYTSQTVLEGSYLLFVYSLGLGLPFLVAGIALSTTVSYLRRLNRFMGTISLVSGILLIAIGVLIFTDKLIILNQYFDFFGFAEI